MYLGVESAKVIGEIILDPSCYISHLDLSRNSIKDEGAHYISAAIARNRSVIILNLA